MTDVFISYAREDRPFVERLHSALATNGFEVWVDWEGIAPTAEWLREVEAAIEGADSFLFVMSPDSIGSTICRRELDHASIHRKRLVPVVHRSVDDEFVPESLRTRNWIFGRDLDDFDDVVEEISTSLRTDLDWVHRHTRLVVRAVEWQMNNRDRSFLLRGRDLDDDERWLGEPSRHEAPAVTDLQLEYLTASRRSANRTNRIRFSAVTVGLVIAVAFGIIALLQRNEARRQATVARARALVASSTAAMPNDPEVGLWLAIEAEHTQRSAMADRLLRQGLLETRLLTTHRLHAAHGPREADAQVAAWLKTKGFPTFSRDGTRSFDGTRVVSMGTVRVARTDGSPVATLSATGQWLHAALNRNGTLVATALPCETCSDPAKVWDVATGRLVATLGNSDAYAVAFNPTANQVVTGDRHGVVRVFDLARPNQPIAQLSAHTDTVFSVEFSSDGHRVVSGSADHTARVWEPAAERSFVLRSHGQHQVDRAEFSSDGKRVATFHAFAGTVRIWDTATFVFRYASAGAHRLDFGVFDDGGDRALLGVQSSYGDARRDQANSVDVLDLRSGKLHQLTFATSYPYEANLGSARFDVAVSGNGRTAVVDGEILDVPSAGKTRVLRGPRDSFRAPALDTQGSRAVTASSTTLNLWNTRTGRRTGAQRLPGVIATSFSHDDHNVAVASQRAGYVLDAATGAQVARLRGSRDIFRRPHFSTNGALLATIAGDGQSVRLWDTHTGALRRAGFGPAVDESVVTVAFSRDDSELVTVSHRGTLRVWDVASGLLLVEAPSPKLSVQNELIDASFSRDLTTIKYVSALGGVGSFACPLCAGTDRLLASAGTHVSPFIKRNADRLSLEARPH